MRIGVNWGSLDQALLTELMDANAALPEPADSRDVMIEAMVQSALRSAELAEETGLGHDQIIISAKVSQVRDLVDVYRRSPARCDYPLHLGLTEAGMGMKGIVASTAGLSLLLTKGIGDTIRVSLTPAPGGDRTEEVLVAQQVLQSLGLRSFTPQVSACPGCGRTTSTFFQEMAEQIQAYLREQMPVWSAQLSGRRGDARRGHGLRRQRPGRVEARRHRHLAAGHVRGAGRAGLRRWRAATTLRGEGLVKEFIGILDDYVANATADRRPQPHAQRACQPSALAMPGATRRRRHEARLVGTVAARWARPWNRRPGQPSVRRAVRQADGIA